MIPSWLVSLLAFLAAWSLWLVRPMPRLVRISLVVPLLYTAIAYAVFSGLVIDHGLRVDITRIGSILIYLSIVVNSLVVRLAWFRRGKYL